jgi:hypothetical protein
MAPHLTNMELDRIKQLAGKGHSPDTIHEKLESSRRRRGIAMVNITNLRKAVKGKTYRKGVKETRGRNKKLSKANLAAIQRARKALIKKADSEFEVAYS